MPNITKPQRSRRRKKIKDKELYDNPKRSSKFPKRETANEKIKPNKDFLKQRNPRGAQALIKFQEHPELLKRKRKTNKHRWNPAHDGLIQKNERGMTVPVKPIPDFRQNKNESEKRYLHRVNMQVRSVLAKAEFEKKYGVDLDNKSLKDGTFNKKTVTKGKTKKKKRLQGKKDERKEREKDKRIEKKNSTGFEYLEDNVAFGEVAMEPPTLNSKPRKATSEGPSRKPGKKSLLLKDILASNSHQSPSLRSVGQTVKRKDQSFAQQRIMNEEREKAINHYRQVKAAKMNHNKS